VSEMYKCPFCGFKPTTLRLLKKHIEKYHFDDECPVCHKKSRNMKSHYYHYMITYKDPQHTLLFYLYSQCRLNDDEKKEVRRLLETVKLEVQYG
jgi:C4-type Zn-finger protein